MSDRDFDDLFCGFCGPCCHPEPPRTFVGKLVLLAFFACLVGYFLLGCSSPAQAHPHEEWFRIESMDTDNGDTCPLLFKCSQETYRCEVLPPERWACKKAKR